jgi:hypothetical protein
VPNKKYGSMRRYQVWRVSTVKPLTFLEANEQARAALSNAGGSQRAYIVEIVGTVEHASPPVIFVPFKGED